MKNPTAPALLLSLAPALAFAQTHTPLRVPIRIDASAELRPLEPRKLGSSNIALWNDKDHFQNPLLHAWITDLKPFYIRIPGGSWSNAHYWNGNGVRGADGKIDHSRIGPDGYPAVDYSAYQPGFNADNNFRPSKGYHGNVDVKTLHDWIKTIPGAVALPCVNAGTGRPIDAAEWVKWAKAQGYNITRWNIGNELGGSWEPGNFLPDGSAITAEEYTRRYNAIAKAMRAVDPSVKLGGCAFAEEMLRDCGDYVDYVSIHTYPGTTTLSPGQNLENATRTVRDEVAKRREWIRKHQPAREKDIEIGYTEWNLSGGLNGSDLFSGLWHSTMLAEFARAGVSFTTQWDIFTHSRGMTAGHALIFSDGNTYTRKAAFHALWLWNNYTGNRQISAPEGWQSDVYTFASRSDDAVYLMLINRSEEKPTDVAVSLSGFDPAATGETATLSNRQYFWNPLTHVPDWSTDLPVTPIPTAGTINLTLPAFSVTHVRVPSKTNPQLTARAKPIVPASEPVELRIVLPDVIYQGDQVTGWVQAVARGTSRPVSAAPATLSGEGATFDRTQASLTDALGRFVVTPSTVGSLTVTAGSGDTLARKTVEVRSSEPRPRVYWDFTGPGVLDKEQFSSEFSLSADETLRANKEVARIDLPAEGVLPSEKDRKRCLLMVRKLPADVQKENIRGVIFDLRTRGVESDDPNAAVLVVMQSPANWWMPLGRVKLSDTKDAWSSHRVMVTEPKHLDAMKSAYNIWFVLASSKPVKGTIALDKVGLMVR